MTHIIKPNWYLLFIIKLTQLTDQGSGVKGRVVQRFPKEDWEGFEFPEDGVVSVSYVIGCIYKT